MRIPNNKQENKQQKVVGETPVINITYILDSSGSMAGPKYENAKKGFIDELKLLKEQKEVNYTFSLIEFSSAHEIYTRFYREKDAEKVLAKLSELNCIRGSTALNDTVVKTLTTLIQDNNLKEKNLISIATDGQEYGSRVHTALDVKNIVKRAEGLGFTVTFIGTEKDLMTAARDYGMDWSNMAAHDNTAAGMEKMSRTRSAATVMYSKAVLDGEDVTKGFYEKLNQEKKK